MSRLKRTLLLALGIPLATAAAALIPAAAMSQPGAPAPAPARQCFVENQWEGWKAADDKTMYVRVGPDRIYRAGFEHGCRGLTDTSNRVTTYGRGYSGSVCTARDLNIVVSGPMAGIDAHVRPTSRILCIATSLTPLTAAEMAALPKRLQP